MIEALSSVALVAAISLGPAVPVAPAVTSATPLASAARVAYPVPIASGRATARVQSGGNDSLRNGAITGAIAGGLAFGLLGSLGCAAGDTFGSSDSSCAGPLIIMTAVGAGAGALIGVGVDALFERAPQTPGSPGGMRKGVQLRVRF